MRVLRWISNLWTAVLILSTLLSGCLVGGRAALPLLYPAPALRSAQPPNGAQEVPVRTRPALTFDQPMNPRTVERALRVEPATPHLLIWDPGFTTLTISPTLGLQPATDYRVAVGETGLSRSLSPLAAPAVVAFRTVAAPAVSSTLPVPGSIDSSPAAPILVRFSRTMVRPEALLRAADGAVVTLDPPVAGRSLWVDQQTLLFQPDARLVPSTRYRATLAAQLADLGGGSLGQPYTWEFQTAAPEVLEASPADGARDVSAHLPLRVTLTPPLPRDRLAAALIITPTLAGRLEAAELPNGTQTITFTPVSGWQPGTAYQATLRLAENATRGWRFTAAPAPALIGRFPGEGQLLPAGQDIRLIFNTPIDPEALRAALRFDPPAEDVRVSGAGSEVRVSAALRAATAYTLMLPADLADQNGVALGAPYVVRFSTAPALPSLALPEAQGRLARYAPGDPVELLVRRTNISALTVDLYDLDEATVVRTLVFDQNDWRLFEPERYQQRLRRSWTVPLSDTLNAAVEDRLAVRGADGQPLPPGLYYLRIRTPEGPRIDLLLAISRARLTFQVGEAGGLVWATDAVTGTVLANLPVALYQDDALIYEGPTDASGLLRFSLSGGQPHTYAALVRGPEPALVTLGPLTLPSPGIRDRHRLLLIADSASYHAGATLHTAGFVRQVLSDTLTLPAGSPQVRLSLRAGDGRVLANLRVSVGASGVFEAAIPLGDAPPGSYRLVAELGQARESLPVEILPALDPTRRVQVRLSQLAAPDTPSEASVLLTSERGLPLAGAPISWTLAAAPAAPPLPEGYSAGVGIFAPPAPSMGAGLTDGAGRLSIPISTTLAQAASPLTYRLTAGAAGDRVAQGEATFTIHPAGRYLGVRLQQRVFAPGEPIVADLLLVDQRGQPVEQAGMAAELTRLDDQSGRVLTSRTLASGADGAAQLQLPAVGGGAYRLRVSTTDLQGRLVVSELPLWVAGQPLASSATALIPDRSAYRPGDTAVLLPVLPADQPVALLTVSQGRELVPEVRAVRQGQPITLSVGTTPERITLLVPGTAQGGPLAASVLLPVEAPPAPFSATLQASSAVYAPGATAQLTLTVDDAGGRTLPTDVLVAVFADPLVPVSGAALAGPDPLALAGNVAVTAGPAMLPMQIGAPAAIFWSGALPTDDGVVRVSVPLPREPARLRAVAWVGGASVVRAETQLAVEQDVAVRLEAPAFVRQGDRFELAAHIENTSAQSQTVALRLRATELEPESGFAEQRVTLAPGELSRVAWPAVARQPAEARVRVEAQPAGSPASDELLVRVRPSARPATAWGGTLVTDTATLAISGQGALTIDLAPSPAAVALRAAPEIAARPGRSVLDDASLLLLTAPLTETRTLAEGALARLATLQAEDGGWGWWPATQAHPLVTAAALEALAAADQAGLPVPERTLSLALAWAKGALASQGDPDVQAQLIYTLSLHGQMPFGSLRELAGQPERLGPQGAASLLLALPPGEARLRDGLQRRLVALAVRSAGRASWRAAGADPGGDAAVSALALRALYQSAYRAPLVEEALAGLVALRGPEGWGEARATAQAIAALQAIWPAPSAPPQFTISLNGERLVQQAGGVWTTSQRLELPVGRLGATSLISATTVGGPLLLSYQTLGPAAGQATDQRALLLRDVLAGDAAGSPGELQAGRAVVVRLTLLVREPIRFARLEVPLPPGAEAQVLPGRLPLALVVRQPDQLVFASELLEPGAYEIRYELRPSYSGTFEVPPARFLP